MKLIRKRWRGLVAASALGVAASTMAGDVLNVGLVPAEDPRVMVQENQALLDHLQRTLHMEVKPFVATDYNGVIEALRAKKLDIALLGPFSYVLAAAVAQVDAFALPDTDRQGPTYRSVIVARKDHGIRTLQDLKGRTFAFVDPSSTSGHLFPKAALIDAGYDPDTYFSRVIFSGGHDASAIAVQNGKVDAAAVAELLLEAAIDRGVVRGEDIVVVWRSIPIPGAPFAYRKDLPGDLKARIRASFAEIHDMPWGGRTVIKRWLPTDDAAYDVVRNTARVLNLDLKKLK